MDFEEEENEFSRCQAVINDCSHCRNPNSYRMERGGRKADGETGGLEEDRIRRRNCEFEMED